jgi:hypothetical protein
MPSLAAGQRLKRERLELKIMTSGNDAGHFPKTCLIPASPPRKNESGKTSYNALHLYLSDMFIKECSNSNISAVWSMRTGAFFGNETVTFTSAVKTRKLELLNVCFLSSSRTSGAIA